MVPQPDALATIESMFPASSSVYQDLMLACAYCLATSVFPRWWLNAPQHPVPSVILTSQLWRFRTRIVASLILGSSNNCTQPGNKPIPIFGLVDMSRSFGLVASLTRGGVGGISFHKRANLAGNNPWTGRRKLAKLTAMPNHLRFGKIVERDHRTMASQRGRRNDFSICILARSTSCI